MAENITLATRRSRLALAQTELVRRHLSSAMAGAGFEVLEMVTTGDKRQKWSLEAKGGKGLFTKELEVALLEGRADLAVHSAKDLPTELEEGLEIAGYLPREVAHDVFVVREDCSEPRSIATGSPRRRAQAKTLFPKAVWKDFRGNVETRLDKIVKGEADATILAAAGLKRLGISQWPGLMFKPLAIRQIVPAVGQGAVALECRAGEAERFAPYLDGQTARAVAVERQFLGFLGGGCHSAYAGHFCGDSLHIYHEDCGYREYSFENVKEEAVSERLAEIVSKLNQA